MARFLESLLHHSVCGTNRLKISYMKGRFPLRTTTVLTYAQLSTVYP